MLSSVSTAPANKTFFRFVTIVIALLFTTIIYVEAQVFTAKKGTITFFSEAPLENIDATNYSIQSILNISNNTVAFIVPIRGFKFKKDLMEEHFNEKYMESDKFPNATYSGKINEEIAFDKNGTYPATSTGKLTIHGVEKTITQPGTITVNNGDITLESSFRIAVKDYGIEIPKLVFENIADTVLVKINVAYQPYKK